MAASTLLIPSAGVKQHTRRICSHVLLISVDVLKTVDDQRLMISREADSQQTCMSFHHMFAGHQPGRFSTLLEVRTRKRLIYGRFLVTETNVLQIADRQHFLIIRRLTSRNVGPAYSNVDWLSIWTSLNVAGTCLAAGTGIIYHRKYSLRLF